MSLWLCLGNLVDNRPRIGSCDQEFVCSQNGILDELLEGMSLECLSEVIVEDCLTEEPGEVG